jgi:hypothetical protein
MTEEESREVVLRPLTLREVRANVVLYQNKMREHMKCLSEYYTKKANGEEGLEFPTSHRQSSIRFAGFPIPRFVTTKSGKKYRTSTTEPIRINAKGYETIWAVQRRVNKRSGVEMDFGPWRNIRVERTDIFGPDGTCKIVPTGQE